MTNREEEIKKKAKELAIYFAGENDYKESAAYSAAMGMADWADQHPREGLWDGKKVIEFIKGNVREYHKSGVFHVDDFVKDLTKAMED